LSKVRIESKWYHESPYFSLVNTDVVSYAHDDAYVKVGLFCLKIPIHTSRYEKERRKEVGHNNQLEDEDERLGDICTYSVDIATNEHPRLQLEVRETIVIVNIFFLSF
jgi:hypothetical protein